MPITDQKQSAHYYEALLQRDPNFVGIFYAGVRTTSVFCIATCRARKPKPENVEFFASFKEALDHGYRPCKICRPTENAEEAPEAVALAIELIRSHPKEKISDELLKEHNIGPETVRRWFKKHYGITFHAFQRMYRVNNALKELKDGKTATAAAFDSGYDSLSGFGYTYKKMIGKAPSQSVKNEVILINRITTPLGPMFVCASPRGICLLEFTDRKILEEEFRDLQRLLKMPIVTGENTHIKQARKELGEYFSGERKDFQLSLDTPGTSFQNQVWTKLFDIPYGQTASYKQQALALEKPKAVRAVARANGANRIAIVIPCHRVISQNGKLTGYSGGLARKQWLLDHEKEFSQT